MTASATDSNQIPTDVIRLGNLAAFGLMSPTTAHTKTATETNAMNSPTHHSPLINRSLFDVPEQDTRSGNYRLASEQDRTDAMVCLANMYADGRGVPENGGEAVRAMNSCGVMGTLSVADDDHHLLRLAGRHVLRVAFRQRPPETRPKGWHRGGDRSILPGRPHSPGGREGKIARAVRAFSCRAERGKGRPTRPRSMHQTPRADGPLHWQARRRHMAAARTARTDLQFPAAQRHGSSCLDEKNLPT